LNLPFLVASFEYRNGTHIPQSSVCYVQSGDIRDIGFVVAGGHKTTFLNLGSEIKVKTLWIDIVELLVILERSLDARI